MKLLFDFFPIVLFFITFKFYEDHREGVLAATAVVIVATIVQVGVTWLRKRKVEKMHLTTLAMIVVLGGATLLLEDEIFIKWKPTAVYWLFSLVFLGSHFIGHTNVYKRLMQHAVQLPDPVWTRLNLSWVVFFALLGFVNLYVVYNFDTETWVNFKLFGLMGLMLVFVLAQGVYMARHMPADDKEGGTD